VRRHPNFQTTHHPAPRVGITTRTRRPAPSEANRKSNRAPSEANRKYFQPPAQPPVPTAHRMDYSPVSTKSSPSVPVSSSSPSVRHPFPKRRQSLSARSRLDFDSNSISQSRRGLARRGSARVTKHPSEDLKKRATARTNERTNERTNLYLFNVFEVVLAPFPPTHDRALRRPSRHPRRELRVERFQRSSTLRLALLRVVGVAVVVVRPRRAFTHFSSEKKLSENGRRASLSEV